MNRYSPLHEWSGASPYALALGLAAVLCAFLALAGWRRRSRPGGFYFALMMGGAALWALFYAFELMTPWLDGKVFWAKLEYVGIIVAPLAWLFFAASYTGAVKRLDGRSVAVLCIIPVATAVIVSTNGLHSLVWTRVWLDSSPGFPHLLVSRGPWFWINAGYSYVVLVAGSVLLLRSVLRYLRAYSAKAFLLVAAIFIPWIGTGLSVLLVRRYAWIDITAFAFLLTGLALMLVMSRWRLFSLLPMLLPLARTRVLETMADGVLVVDMDGTVVTANPGALAVFGRSGGLDPVGMPIAELLGTKSRYEGQSHDGRGHRFDFSLGDGEEGRHFDVVSSPLGFWRGAGALLVLRDITERERTEAALRGSEERFRAVFEQGSFGIAVSGREQRILRANPAFCRMLGFEEEELIDRSIDEVTAPEDIETTQRSIGALLDARTSALELDKRYVRKDGSLVWAHTSGAPLLGSDGRPVGIVAMMQDIGERKLAEQALARAEEQLRQSQKMEAVGQLAGGIAHDFNNLLTAIIGNSELTLETMAPGDPSRVFVRDIKEVGERAAGLTRQILAFSRRQMLKPEVVCMNSVVRRMEPMLCRTIGEEIQVETRLAADLRPVEVDPHQMEQVLMNLAVNARDAMPGGGRLTIETAMVHLDEAHCMAFAHLEPGPHVMLAVTDTGRGMDRATCARAFEPFFTTKEQGRGTGLGLSTVFGIVHQSGGSICVESAVGKGSTFIMHLPVCRSVDAAGSEGPPSRDAESGSGNVLVVEDERSVRELVVRILKRAGYSTSQAGSAAEVDMLLEESGSAFDLLITDVVLPGGRSGREVAAGLRRLQADIPIIFMSGYTQDSTVFDGSAGGYTDFLEKPFAADALLIAVREALSARAESA